MPALTRAFTKELRGLERLFGLDLGTCIAGYEIHDPAAAFQYARTYAIEFYDLYYGFYSQYPAYREHWRPASAAFALGRVIQGINGFSILPHFFEQKNRVARIRRTISDHAKRDETPLLTGKQAQMLARAGVDISSASPLLLSVLHAQAQAGQQAANQKPQRNTREAVVLPLLEAKGWSILEWADNSYLAYHTAADYLAGKTDPYRSTRKKLAESIGLSVQQLPK